MTETRPLLLLLSNFQGIIPQKDSLFRGLDERLLTASCEQHGIESRSLPMTDERVWTTVRRPNVGAIYSAAQTPRYQRLLRDIASNLAEAGVRLYPGTNALFAHEDKAFQELRLRLTNIPRPKTWLFGTRCEAQDFLQTAPFPLVAKTSEGSCSRGVRLVRTMREGNTYLDECMTDEFRDQGRSLPRRVWERLRPPRPVGLALFQEFVPALEGDWKVLVWGEVACALYRTNRPKDFRASGGGRLSFIETPDHVLEFAWRARKQLGLLWGAFDVLVTPKNECLLGEYQAIHFGTATAERGRFYYARDANGRWTQHSGRIAYEREMVTMIAEDMRAIDWLKPRAAMGGERCP